MLASGEMAGLGHHRARARTRYRRLFPLRHYPALRAEVARSDLAGPLVTMLSLPAFGVADARGEGQR
jgi:hypothetical protein